MKLNTTNNKGKCKDKKCTNTTYQYSSKIAQLSSKEKKTEMKVKIKFTEEHTPQTWYPVRKMHQGVLWEKKKNNNHNIVWYFRNKHFHDLTSLIISFTVISSQGLVFGSLLTALFNSVSVNICRCIDLVMFSITYTLSASLKLCVFIYSQYSNLKNDKSTWTLGLSLNTSYTSCNILSDRIATIWTLWSMEFLLPFFQIFFHLYKHHSFNSWSLIFF